VRIAGHQADGEAPPVALADERRARRQREPPLKSAKRRRGVKPPSSSPTKLAAAPGEDPVEVEMRRITEQLREQGSR
jgi:hypothetical protein